jgi:large subunit ribosomal protein L13
LAKIIDASGLVAGRLASEVAKLALSGERIDILNSEKAVISGKPAMIIKVWHKRLARKDTMKGPFTPKRADQILRRIIRGMLPRSPSSDESRGRKAYRSVMCWLGVPKQFADKKFDDISAKSIEQLKTKDFITLGELSANLRGYSE